MPGTHADLFVVATALVLLVGIAALPRRAAGGGWQVPKIELAKDAKHPVVACTAEELKRLRAAYRSDGPQRGPIAQRVARADAAIGKALSFPPRGGQHNQWYQCEACQMGLKTIDDTHHKCPKCGHVYSGPPYDDVIFARKHGRNLWDMEAAAWAYAITGERKYAEFAAKVLLGYAERYLKYPYHDSRCLTGAKASRSGGRLFEQTLNEAMNVTWQVGPAYDLIAGSDALSDADREKIRTGLIEPMLRNIAKHKAGKSNWQTWHNAAMVWGGAAIGDANWVRQAVADPKNGFAYQMQVSVSGDGMWYENSWGYHFYTLMAMVQMAEGARRCGIDLYSHPAMKKMFTLPVRYTMADGSLPRFGDDVNSSAFRQPSLMAVATHAYKDPAIGALLPERPTWETVLLGLTPRGGKPELPKGSEVFRSAGHAILRTQGPAGLTAAMTFGPYGGFHGHFDKLSFVLLGCGQELGVDPGRAASQAYRLPIHGNWYKATIGHNAVLVDGKSQKPATGKLESFGATPSYAAVVASCDAAYPGVKHRRMLCLTPTYLLVVDDLSSDKPHRYDWVYHNRGKAVRCETARDDVKPPKDMQGMEYVKNLKRGAAEGGCSVRFDGNDVTTYLAIGSNPGVSLSVLVGDGVGASVLDRVPMVVVGQQGKAARFVAVLEPTRKAPLPAVMNTSVAERSGSIEVSVWCGDATDIVTLGKDHAVSVRHGEKVVLQTKPEGR